MSAFLIDKIYINRCYIYVTSIVKLVTPVTRLCNTRNGFCNTFVTLFSLIINKLYYMLQVLHYIKCLKQLKRFSRIIEEIGVKFRYNRVYVFTRVRARARATFKTDKK